MNQRLSLSLFSPMSQQPYSMLPVTCLRRGQGSLLSWHDLARCFGFGSMPAQVMLISSVSGFLLPRAVFRFSLDEIKLDGFHNGVSAARLLKKILRNSTTCGTQHAHAGHVSTEEWTTDRRKAAAVFRTGSCSDAARDLEPVSLMASHFR